MCPNCKSNIKAVRLVFGPVVVSCFHCRCGHSRRELAWSTPVQLTAPEISGHINLILRKNSEDKSDIILEVVRFLSMRMEELRPPPSTSPTTLRKKRNDLWEKQFLKAALDDWG